MERRFPREIAIVGVHSGKYTTERVTARIREAALRLGNTHPVVNDRQYRIWRSYAVTAWPTLVAIDPHGAVIGTHAGEFTSEMVEPFVERVIGAFDPTGEIDRAPHNYAVDTPAVEPGLLRYPGKVAVDGSHPEGARISIADTGHHRVLVGRLVNGGRTMRVDRVIGRSERGFEDGVGGALDTPHGLLFHDDTLYIADAENHAVRAADLATGALSTVAGTGRQLRTREDLAAGALSSPWDLARVGDTLFVAMAGNHRLYAIDLATRRARVHSGSGAEDIHDGPHASAALAQPMGITTDGERLYFADAESSAVRWSDVAPSGGVGTIVGTGLFDFGDRDGAGDDVRMQHQQAIALHPDGRLLVADSYNDALKWVDRRTRVAETWVRDLHEPSGLAISGDLVYVADTNAHRIAVVDANGEVGTLEIEVR